MKDQKEFAKDFAAKLVTKLEVEGVKVSSPTVDSILKNNDTPRTAVLIKEEGSNIAPTIYIDQYYENIENGTTTMEEAVDHAFNMFMNSRQSEIAEYVNSSENILEQATLSIRAINAIRNEERLKDVPHKMITDDLALCVIGELPVGKGEAVVTINKSSMNALSMNEEELFNKAMDNLQKEAFSVKPIVQVLGDFVEEDSTLEEIDNCPLFVATNSSCGYGAKVIARTDILSQFAEEHGDFYILPSSVHELLFVPASKCDEPDRLQSMVQEVNSTCIAKEDFLSDNVLFYSKEGLVAV